ncbi:MAG: histidinol-phosphate transaminase [Desulfobulbus sp.]|jgi:histidinol-phosphate aminotransferase|uniref:histidinol-phosphate transaminase n=1 Tax=Desulfobulbus sp. TaxID=895 RepID=UPI0028429F89|nr:histidinol-phosphate transaminase [Desulfobulbus sp.]MDR2551265.1 histidinol-phosphate transaminase [Desulfobulbus sp.]
MQLPVPQHIAAIVPYPPGKPMDELEREYGITNAIKLASNENPWGPSPKAVAAIGDMLHNLHRYPDGSSYYLAEAVANWIGAAPEEIVLGNGSNEVIEFLVKAFVGCGDAVITSHPSFLMYQKFVQVRGGDNVVIPLKEMDHDLEAITQAVTTRTRLIFIDNPNNPTGTLIGRERFARFLAGLPESVIVVVDEAYVDFVDPDQRIDILGFIRNPERIPAVVSLRTFSKAFGLAGLRVGFGVMHRQMAALLHRVRQPFNINLPAQAGALAALDDREHYDATLRGTAEGRAWLSKTVAELGCRPYPSHTNFFLIDVGGDATRLYEAMLYKGVIVRSMKAYGYPEFIRITVGTAAENQRFVSALGECLRDLGYCRG